MGFECLEGTTTPWSSIFKRPVRGDRVDPPGLLTPINLNSTSPIYMKFGKSVHYINV